MEPRQGTATPTIDAYEWRTELLSRIGLPADATDRDVDTVHRAAASLLERAPEDQKAWAAEQLASIEAVRSLLDELEPPVEAAETAAGDEVPVEAAAVAATAGRRNRWAWAVAAVVVALGAAFGVHLMTSNNGVPALTGTPDTSTTATAPALDQAKVGALMQKISANPKDAASYAELATLYFAAQDYKNAQQFATKVTVLDPKNTTGWLALGASQFNLGDAKGAEKSWNKVVALNPKNAEAHYDLGFLYLSQANPDMAKVKAEWQKVIDIDPKADIAQTVKTHLDSLSKATPAPSSK